MGKKGSGSVFVLRILCSFECLINVIYGNGERKKAPRGMPFSLTKEFPSFAGNLFKPFFFHSEREGNLGLLRYKEKFWVTFDHF